MTSITFSTLTQKIAALLAQQAGRPLLIALDGRCGSGKTTLAAQLAQQFPASAVFHTDDYYLPPAQRIPNWAETPCANMDLARLREELLCPARAGQPVHYCAYSCREGAYRPAVLLAPQPLYIIEGSYSQHPSLADLYDCTVFVTCSQAEQARRLQAREGERYQNFVQRWIPLEEAYFKKYGVEGAADFTIDTSC